MNSLYKLSNSGIQNLLKEKISKSQMIEFLQKTINESNIAEYAKLLNTDLINEKYTFDLILAGLYKEAFSLKVANDIIEEYTNYEEIFEKIAVLEYEIYSLTIEDTLPEETNDDAILYIRNIIKNIYYGQKNLLSYKDETNIELELEKIFNSISPIFESENWIYNINSKSLTRINNEPCLIEGENIAYYNFLLNYNVDNKYFIRKYYAINFGNYEKDGTTKELSTLNDIPELEYSNYSLIVNANHLAAHNFLNEFYQEIHKRTINY